MATRRATAEIVNRLGLHARPAMTFVERASTFKSEVKVHKEDQAVDGKSIMQMMMLAATCGTKLEIEATGDDADRAVEELKRLIESGFDED